MRQLRIILCGLLLLTGISLEAQQLQMERDYQILSQRYDKRVKDDKNLPIDLRNYQKT